MLRRLLAIALLLLLQPLPCRADGVDVAVLQTSTLLPYEGVKNSFLRHYATLVPVRGTKSIQSFSSDQYLLSEQGEDEVRRRLSDRAPRLVVAIGGRALELATDSLDLPILFLLVPEAAARIERHPHLTGVLLEVEPSRQLALFADRLPGRRFGTVYLAGALEKELALAGDLAAGRGFELRPVRVASAEQAPAAFRQLAAEVDVLWLLADSALLSPANLTYVFSLSAERRIPVVSFTDVFLKQGAALGISFDLDDMGRQAAEMAARIARGTPIGDIPPQPPRDIHVETNPNVLRKLGLTLSPEPLE
ncbi:MAG: ABC transporter substrate binding protein [Thermodesulfobacteriota bacterium]